MADEVMELSCDHCGRTKSIDSHGSMIGEACHHCGIGYWRVRPAAFPPRPARDGEMPSEIRLCRGCARIGGYRAAHRRDDSVLATECHECGAWRRCRLFRSHYVLPPARDGETLPEWGMPVRYLTDDRDSRERYELVVLQGGNGDWYVSVLPEDHRLGPTVRICTSGGAASSRPDLPGAVANVYRALRREPSSPPARDGETLSDEQFQELLLDYENEAVAWGNARHEDEIEEMGQVCVAKRNKVLAVVAALRAECARLTAEREEITQACNTGMRLRLPAEQIVARIRAARAAAPTPVDRETSDG